MSDSSSILLGILLWILCFSVGVQVLGLICYRHFLASKPKARIWSSDQPAPGISIIKPCHADTDNESENFLSFFEQDYPGSYELLFVVSSETAPIVPLLRSLIARYPQRDARIIVSRRRKAFWKKVDALHDGHAQARFPIVIWSDSDVIVERSYLNQMASALLEPGVSVVSTPQWDVGADNAASAWKALGNNCDVTVLISILDAFTQLKRVSFGQSIGFWKEEFDRFTPDPWQTMDRFLADDQALPYLFAMRGLKVVFRNISCPVHFASKRVRDVVQQKLRWLLPQVVGTGNRAVYFVGGFVISPVLMGALYALARGFDSQGMIGVGVAVGARWFVSAITEQQLRRAYKNDPGYLLRYFWAVPLWDLSQAAFLIIGACKRTMSFDGKTFRVVEGHFLEEICEEPQQAVCPTNSSSS